jgi:hypothetical protein
MWTQLLAFVVSLCLGYVGALWFAGQQPTATKKKPLQRGPQTQHLMANEKSVRQMSSPASVTTPAAVVAGSAPLKEKEEETPHDETEHPIHLMKRNKTKDELARLQTLKTSATHQQHQRESVSMPPHAMQELDAAEERKANAGNNIADVIPSHPIYCPLRPPLNDEQQDAVAQLRANVADVMTEFYASDPTTYVRFLRARQWNVSKAELMLRNAIDWRSKLSPLEPLRNLVSLNLKTELFNMDKFDIYGRPILYSCVRRHNPKLREIEPSVRAIVWVILNCL